MAIRPFKMGCSLCQVCYSGYAKRALPVLVRDSLAWQPGPGRKPAATRRRPGEHASILPQPRGPKSNYCHSPFSPASGKRGRPAGQQHTGNQVRSSSSNQLTLMDAIVGLLVCCLSVLAMVL